MTSLQTLEAEREQLLRHLRGLRIQVQSMVRGATELILGTFQDPKFGPLLMFGLGGIHVEYLKDVTFGIHPITRYDAREMIRSIRGRALLEGARGKPAVDLELVLLADASDAVIVGFHVVASPHARDLAEQHGVEVRLYRVIYDVTDDITKGLEGMLDPESREQALGTAELRQVFKVSKIGQIAGCLVTEGAVRRNAKVRVIRDGVVITENRDLLSLRRVKDDVNEVRAGTECGIRLAGFDDLKPGDELVCYEVQTVARQLG